MVHLSFYVSEEVAHKVRQKARFANMSVSRYVTELIKREVSHEWPEDYFETVIGGWQGETLQRPNQDSMGGGISNIN